MNFFELLENRPTTFLPKHIQAAIAKMDLTIARTQQSKIYLFQTDYLEE